MGGIFTVMCINNIPRGVIYEGLRRLVYRGYDGVGVAILRGDSIEIRKAPGHFNNVTKQIDLVNIDSNIAIGHTRYASRGWPVYENTHPLLDCSGKIAVISDGIIDNYEEWKMKLEKKEHVFKSRTDTEVAAHLLEDYLRNGLDTIHALLEIGNLLMGNYALVFLIAPFKKLLIIQHGQPLVIGLNVDKTCIYVSSDLPSLHGFAETAYIVEDNSVGEISLDKIELYSIHGKNKIDISTLQSKRVKYIVEHVEKGGFPHFMIKEIYDIPEALSRTTLAVMEKYLRLSSMIIHGARRVYAIGTGTSLHAALTSTYYFSEVAGVNIIPVSAAEFPYSILENIVTGDVILAISQSGETSDVITSVKLAKQRGAVIIGITNNVGSRLALESNVYLPIGAGPEMAVPATKTFTSTLATLLLLAYYTGVFTGKKSMKEYSELVNEIKNYSAELRNTIPFIEEKVSTIAEKIKDARSLYISSSGITYPIAIEGSLKIKEAALIHAEGIQLGELKHGPLSIINPGFPIILIEPYEEQAHPLYSKILHELESKKAFTASIESKLNTKHCTIKLSPTTKYLYPISTVIVLQLLAYKLGVARGLPVDTPPGLAKTVTT